MNDTKLSPGGQTKGGGSQHWCTPPDIVGLTQKVFDTSMIDLDPFSNPNSVVGAKHEWWGPPHDTCGFSHSWEAVANTVFFNPPWNRSGDAVRKADEEWSGSGGDIEIIGLIPCSMNAKHWPLVERAPARCYLNRRPSFMVDGKIKRGNPKDVAIVYWGSRPYRFADVFSEVGRIHFGVIA